MDLFLDSSNPKEILEARSWGLLAGVTSNPGLIAAAGPDMEKTLGAIVDASPGPVFAQVIGWHDPEPMIAPGALVARLFGPDHCQAASQCRRPAGAPADLRLNCPTCGWRSRRSPLWRRRTWPPRPAPMSPPSSTARWIKPRTQRTT